MEWTNLTEKDVVNYQIESSLNGRDFKAIGLLPPKDNRGERADFNSFDGSPLPGLNHYRIKVLEIGGRVIYSKILSVNLGIKSQGLLIYPNPVTGGIATMRLSGLKPGQYQIQVTNMTGQNVSSRLFSVTGFAVTNTLDFSGIKPGMYSILVTGNGYRESKTFVIQ